MTPIFLSALIMAVAIAAFLLFELLYNLHRQKKMEKLQAALDKKTARSGLTISKQQLLGDRIIGFDERKNKVLFLQLAGKKTDRTLIDLDTIRICKVDKTYTSFWHGREKGGVLVQTISLQFTYKNGSAPLLLPFYLNTVDQVFEIKDRDKQATEWQMLLSSRLKHNTITMAAHKKYPGERLLVA